MADILFISVEFCLFKNDVPFENLIGPWKKLDGPKIIYISDKNVTLAQTVQEHVSICTDWSVKEDLPHRNRTRLIIKNITVSGRQGMNLGGGGGELILLDRNRVVNSVATPNYKCEFHSFLYLVTDTSQ